MHSEDMADQDGCVALIGERIGRESSNYPFGLGHRDTIARFGRFPARNAALGRVTTPEEAAFLNAGLKRALTGPLPPHSVLLACERTRPCSSAPTIFAASPPISADEHGAAAMAYARRAVVSFEAEGAVDRARFWFTLCVFLTDIGEHGLNPDRPVTIHKSTYPAAPAKRALERRMAGQAGFTGPIAGLRCAAFVAPHPRLPSHSRFTLRRTPMPLDPLVKAFLDSMKAVPGPKMSELRPAAARETFVGLMQMVGPKDVPVGKTENIVVPSAAGGIPIRVYSPVAAGQRSDAGARLLSRRRLRHRQHRDP